HSPSLSCPVDTACIRGSRLPGYDVGVFRVLGVEVRHEGANEDSLASRLAEDLEGPARQLRRNALPRELVWHFGVNEGEIAVRVTIVSRRDRRVVNRTFETMLVPVLDDISREAQ